MASTVSSQTLDNSLVINERLCSGGLRHIPTCTKMCRSGGIPKRLLTVSTAAVTELASNDRFCNLGVKVTSQLHCIRLNASETRLLTPEMSRLSEPYKIYGMGFLLHGPLAHF